MRPTPPSSDNDGPARKKRKVSEPKERTTERLNLLKDGVESDPKLKRVLDVLHRKRKIVVIAGAGISVSAGIPDFRSSGGLFSSLRKQHKLKSSGKDLFDASVYQDDSSTSSFHDMVRSLSQKTKVAEPTPFHHLIATLAEEGRLLRLYSQNVDGIDTSLPPLKTQVPLPKKAPWPKTVQLHGGLDHMVCSKCHTLSDFDAEQFNGPVPPACPHCTENDQVRQVAEKRSHGIGRLRPRMVLYNEHNPDDEAIGACASLDLRTRPDAVIVAGTTLKVPGVRRIAREMCAVVRDRRDGVTIWINNDPEPVGKDLANSWDIVVQGPCDEIARHAAMPRWDDPITHQLVTDDEINKLKEKQKPVVVVPATPKKCIQVTQTLTPAASPRRGFELKEPQEEVSTPSKRGRKRRAETQPALTNTKAKAPVKRQTQKKAPAKRKEKGKENQKVTDMYKTTKSTTSARTSVGKKQCATTQVAVKSEADPYFNSFNVIQPQKPMMAPNHELNLKVMPTTPRVRKAATGCWKQDHLATIHASDPRMNMSPERPPVEPFTSRPGSPEPSSPPYRSPESLDQEYFTADEERPSTANSRKSDMIVPPSAPRAFDNLLHMTG
jgi:NAD-dependent histone deacetylase SIR2